MDLNLTPAEEAFRQEIRSWFAQNLPHEWKMAQVRALPEDDAAAVLRKWQLKLGEAGWLGLSWPVEYGGRGGTLMEQAIYLTEGHYADAPLPLDWVGLRLLGPTLMDVGTPELRARYLNPVVSGQMVWCQGFSEPNAGSDLASLLTEARPDGSDFIVNGQKVWTSYGWAADWCELVVRTDPAAPKHKGLTVLLIDMRSPGVEVRPLRQMTGESEFNEVFFRDVRVPAANVLGAVNNGWNVALGTLMHERATLGAGLHIVYSRQFQRLVKLAHSIDRNGAPAARDPVVRQKLAQIYAEIEIMRLNQMRSISRISQSGAPGPEGSIQKIFWSELNQRFQQVAQEVLGPFAQLEKGSEFAFDDGQWAYSYLRARGNTIEAGTSEIQRNIIGHFVLGLPRSY